MFVLTVQQDARRVNALIMVVEGLPPHALKTSNGGP